MDIPDKRKLEDLKFGSEPVPPETPREEWTPENQAAMADFVRSTLARCGVEVADDVSVLGCTGLAKAGVSIEDARRLRLGMGGSGVGLPCFVPIQRFCLVHNTVGGLQEGQAVHHLAAVSLVSRDLTVEEKKYVDRIESVRRIKGSDRVETALETLRDSKDGVPASAPAPTAETRPWTCPHHTNLLLLDCRYCVAAAVVAGPFQPELVVKVGDDPYVVGVDVNAVEAQLARDVSPVTVYVRAAKWSRKLARD